MIYIQYEKTDGSYTFFDVIVLEDDHTLSDIDLENIKQTRFENWITAINNPQPIVESSVIIDETENA